MTDTGRQDRQIAAAVGIFGAALIGGARAIDRTDRAVCARTDRAVCARTTQTTAIDMGMDGTFATNSADTVTVTSAIDIGDPVEVAHVITDDGISSDSRQITGARLGRPTGSLGTGSLIAAGGGALCLRGFRAPRA